MSPNNLNILFISDLHYINQAAGTCEIPKRKTALGPILIRKALERMFHAKKQVDLLILGGDLVNDGTAENAAADLAEIADTLKKSNIRTLVVPGNHDAAPAEMAKIFESPAGFHDINGYGFLLFHDDIASENRVFRPEDQLEWPAQARAQHLKKPLFVLQHNPIYPPIKRSYPYMLENNDHILDSYRDAGVLLSLSGHFHQGQLPTEKDGTTYYTVPAICEAPFRFAFIQLQNQAVTISEHELEFYRPEFIDYHCHSEFAYCAADVSLEKNQQVINEMGLPPLIQTEHAFHLYFDKKTAYDGKWQLQTVALDDTWQAELPHNRMPEFKQIAKKGRENGRRFGLELDLRTDGSLLLADSDRDGWDILLGAIHHIPDFIPEKNSLEEAANLFLRDTQRLLQHPIDVLAHPFRFFRRNNLPVPPHLFPKVAALLAKSGIAAEINFHTNMPDPRFFNECLNRGVKLALGTDAHRLAEVGELWPHYQFLKQLNIPPEKMADILFIPARFQNHKKDKDAD